MRRAIGLFELLDKYDTEKKRRRLLEQLRWPNGIACPRCGSVTVNRVESRNALDCYDCRYVFYVTSGTAMHGTHLPMHKWFDIDTLLNTKLNKMYIEDIQSMGYLILGWENVYRYFDAMLNFKGHRPRRRGKCAHYWVLESQDEAFKRSRSRKYSMGPLPSNRMKPFKYPSQR